MECVSVFPTIDLRQTGKRIERLRRERGFSVRQLQAYFGFEYPQAIYKWQWGECLPSVDNLFALARLFGVKMEDLLVSCSDQEVSHFFHTGRASYPSSCHRARSWSSWGRG